jgi:hypothetical protein
MQDRHLPSECRRVRTMTFASLARTHGIEKLDLVAVDTEGYDFEILNCSSCSSAVESWGSRDVSIAYHEVPDSSSVYAIRFRRSHARCCCGERVVTTVNVGASSWPRVRQVFRTIAPRSSMRV